MGFLFMITGYFVAGSCNRKGFGQFVGERFKRLVIPCGCAWRVPAEWSPPGSSFPRLLTTGEGVFPGAGEGEKGF